MSGVEPAWRRAVALALALLMILSASGTAIAESDVEQRIAAFWERVNAMSPSEHLSSADLGQWALNVIERDASARLTVADFRTATVDMQQAMDRARSTTPLPAVGSVEERIAEFWDRVNSLSPSDHVSSADLGQWALNVIERDSSARLTVADFRTATGEMQQAMDRAGHAPVASAAAPPLSGDRVVPAGSFRLASAMNILTTAQGGTALPSIAVGQESFIVITNPRTLIYSRAGELIADDLTQTMFSSVIPPGTSITDPRILFDERSGRFFATGAAGPECEAPNCTVTWAVAVSKTSVPRSLGPADWYFYGLDGSLENGVPTGQTGDFNVIAVTDDVLVLTGISIPPDWAAYAKIWVFPKAPFLTGAPVAGPSAEFTRLRDPWSGRLLEKTFPAVMSGSPDTVFLASWSSDQCALVILGISGPAEASELRMHTARASGNCGGGAMTAPQLGGGTPVDAGIRFHSPPFYRDGHLWVVDVVPRGGAGDESALRLVELDVSRWPEEPTYLLDETYSEPDISYFSAAVAVDQDHNVVIAANRSSAAEYPSFWMTGRRASDAVGTFRTPVAIKHGEANWSWTQQSHEPPIRIRNRFSAWTGAAIDPVDGSAWVVGQTTRTACYWDLWIARTDFETVASTSGAPPPLAPPVVRDRPCSERDSGPDPRS